MCNEPTSWQWSHVFDGTSGDYVIFLLEFFVSVSFSAQNAGCTAPLDEGTTNKPMLEHVLNFFLGLFELEGTEFV